MPDGNFWFLFSYIDHGIKKLMSMPLVAKQAAVVALALWTIITEQSPPSILQTDNSSEFAGSVVDHVRRKMILDDAFMELVIKEVKMLWPEFQMVRGSPCHSESNGGVTADVAEW
jgi:hypothetical protein